MTLTAKTADLVSATDSSPIPARRHDFYPSREQVGSRILPRRDPVVYGNASISSPLDDEQVESFSKRGFLIIESLFDTNEVDLLLAELDTLKADSSLQNQESLIFEPSSNEVRSIFRVHHLSQLFARLSQDKRLVDTARFLLGDEVYLHQTRLNFKPGFFGKEFYWHSDFETWHTEDGMPAMRALSVSISLSDNSDINGPLMLIPGSHLQYVACQGETPENHYKTSLRAQNYGVPDPDSITRLVKQGGIESVRSPAGSVVFFDCNTMHGSNSNITPFQRTNAFFVYNSVSNSLQKPFAAMQPRPGFLAEREHLDPIQSRSGRLTATAC